MPDLTLEVGKTYISKVGNLVTIQKSINQNDQGYSSGYRFIGRSFSTGVPFNYKTDGKRASNDRPHSQDIVREAVDSDYTAYREKRVVRTAKSQATRNSNRRVREALEETPVSDDVESLIARITDEFCRSARRNDNILGPRHLTSSVVRFILSNYNVTPKEALLDSRIFQINLGKSYFSRSGESVTITEVISPLSPTFVDGYRFIDNRGKSYTASGEFLPGAQTSFDLISQHRPDKD